MPGHHALGHATCYLLPRQEHRHHADYHALCFALKMTYLLLVVSALGAEFLDETESLIGKLTLYLGLDMMDKVRPVATCVCGPGVLCRSRTLAHNILAVPWHCAGLCNSVLTMY